MMSTIPIPTDVARRFCGTCGHEIRPQASFCGTCGQTMAQRRPAQPPAGPAGQAESRPWLIPAVAALVLALNHRVVRRRAAGAGRAGLDPGAARPAAAAAGSAPQVGPATRRSPWRPGGRPRPGGCAPAPCARARGRGACGRVPRGPGGPAPLASVPGASALEEQRSESTADSGGERARGAADLAGGPGPARRCPRAGGSLAQVGTAKSRAPSQRSGGGSVPARAGSAVRLMFDVLSI